MCVCAYQYPLKRTLHIEQFCCDSPREQWLPLIETFKEVARLRGCADIEITGRRGWTKVLPELGFKESCVTMNLELDPPYE